MMMAVGCQPGNAGTPDAAAGDQKVKLDSEIAKSSYAIGFNMGQSMRNIKDKLDFAVVLQGLRDGFAGDDKAQMPVADIRKTITAFQQKLRTEMNEKRKAQGAKNKGEGEAFIKENAKKEGVITTKSGLQYKIIKKGTGASPKAVDTVEVHYRGTLIDGTEFDSSYKRGTTIKFALNRVIPGWTEGVQLMKVGAKYKFFVPSNLAYGQRGAGQQIGPDAALIFDIELISIIPAGEKKKPAPVKPPKPKALKKQPQKK
ncbi:MAG: FKBP-type peptidyl-prolyl cis-trans isomerase [bacterium]|nr:FKBP-type peptidyl-prolyl cis-trans isomerase [bacterium]